MKKTHDHYACIYKYTQKKHESLLAFPYLSISLPKKKHKILFFFEQGHAFFLASFFLLGILPASGFTHPEAFKGERLTSKKKNVHLGVVSLRIHPFINERPWMPVADPQVVYQLATIGWGMARKSLTSHLLTHHSFTHLGWRDFSY